jgi:CHASE3 domain sensor protein/tRNA A-37 threonylcarbamoyl transferase component Bud32
MSDEGPLNEQPAGPTRAGSPVNDSRTPITVPPIPDALESAQLSPALHGYEVIEELGRGGMGVVYKARQLALDRVVALKMILTGSHAGPEERLRFLTEAEAVAAVDHPNVVKMFDFGTEGGAAYCAMEFCHGGTLAQMLNGVPLQPAEAGRVVESVARGVHAAHEKGIVHRDLKPGNVLVCPRNAGRIPDVREKGRPVEPGSFEVKVADFGLARREGGAGMTRTGVVIGTPAYLSPEQARGEKVGRAADVWALGAILYECLTGRPPFRAATDLETLTQVLTVEPVSVRALQPKTPRDLETICHKCLHKTPAKRYSSAAELADDLRRWHAGEPIRARRVTALEKVGKWVGRNPLPALLLASSLVIVMLSLLIFVQMAVVALLTFSQLGRMNAMRLANETSENLAALEAIQSLITEVELGQLAYLASNDQRELLAYEKAKESLEPALAGLSDRMSDNPTQSARLENLKRLVADYLAVADRILALFRARGSEAAVAAIRAGEQRRLRDSQREVIAVMKAEESKSLESWLGQALR